MDPEVLDQPGEQPPEETEPVNPEAANEMPVDEPVPVDGTEPTGEQPESSEPSPNRFYYLIINPDGSDQVDAYYVDPEEGEETAPEEGEFVAAKEEGITDFFRGITGGRTNTRTNVINEPTGRTNVPMNDPFNMNRNRVGVNEPDPINRNRTNINDPDPINRNRIGVNDPDPINRNRFGMNDPDPHSNNRIGAPDPDIFNRNRVDVNEGTNRINAGDDPNNPAHNAPPIHENIFADPSEITGNRTGGNKPNIFNVIGDRLNEIVSRPSKPVVNLPKLDGRDYQIPPPKELVKAFSYNGRDYPDLPDPRSTGKYPPEIVEIFDKLTPGIDKTASVRISPSEEVRAAVKLLKNGKDSTTNYRMLNNLSMEALNYNNAGTTYQQKMTRMDGILSTAKNYKTNRIVIKTSTGDGATVTKTIKPQQGRNLWAYKINGEHRPIPPFDIDAISPGLSNFLEKPPIPEVLTDLVDGNGVIKLEVLNRELQGLPEGSEQAARLQQAYDVHTRNMGLYDQYNGPAVELSNKIQQLKDNFGKHYGKYAPLDIDTQRKLFEKVVAEDSNSGLIAEGVRMYDSDVSESTASGSIDHYLDRLVVEPSTNNNPYSAMVVGG